MPHRRPMVRTGQLMLLLAVAAGCGGPSRASGNPPPAPPPGGAATIAAKSSGVPCAPIPTEPGEVIYQGVGVRTYPAPAGTRATLTVDEALAGPDVADWGRGSSREAGLRLVTTGDFGCDPEPTGVGRRAGGVVTIHGTVPVHGGPPGGPTADPAVTCFSVVIVDARTGALLSNSQTCGQDAPGS